MTTRLSFRWPTHHALGTVYVHVFLRVFITCHKASAIKIYPYISICIRRSEPVYGEALFFPFLRSGLHLALSYPKPNLKDKALSLPLPLPIPPSSKLVQLLELRKYLVMIWDTRARLPLISKARKYYTHSLTHTAHRFTHMQNTKTTCWVSFLLQARAHT